MFLKILSFVFRLNKHCTTKETHTSFICINKHITSKQINQKNNKQTKQTKTNKNKNKQGGTPFWKLRFLMERERSFRPRQVSIQAARPPHSEQTAAQATHLEKPSESRTHSQIRANYALPLPTKTKGNFFFKKTITKKTKNVFWTHSCFEQL
jgi:hypothetical protein